MHDRSQCKMKRLAFTSSDGPLSGATERGYADGHRIGEHTDGHGRASWNRRFADRAAEKIGQSQNFLGALFHALKLFRPNDKGRLGPSLLGAEALAYLVDNRMTLVAWDNVPRDWEELRRARVENVLTTLTELPWPALMPHDAHVAGMMDTLAELDGKALAMGAKIVQDLPASYVPNRKGRAEGSGDDLMTPKPRIVAETLDQPDHKREELS